MIEKTIETCDGEEIHEELLNIVREKMPEETELYDLAELFKVFGDSTRIRILFVLFETEVCVCDLAQALNMTQSAISQSLSAPVPNHFTILSNSVLSARFFAQFPIY